MMALLRLRLVGIVLALVMGLGGGGDVFAQRMPTLDDLVIVEAMAAGATAADFCGKDGKALLAGASARMGHVVAGVVLPAHRPPLVDIALQAARASTVPPPPLFAYGALDPGHGCRAPPILSLT